MHSIDAILFTPEIFDAKSATQQSPFVIYDFAIPGLCVHTII